MKLRRMMTLWILVMVLAILTGCGQPAADTIPGEAESAAFGIAPGNSGVEIPDESVPLASGLVDVSDGIDEREAEAIALANAGFQNKEVSFLFCRYAEEGSGSCYRVSFRNSNILHEFRIDAVTGEVLSYEKGD